MGCAQSTRPSFNSGLEKMKLETGYAATRRPTAMMKQESRNRNRGRPHLIGEMDARKSVSSNGGERADLPNKEDEEVEVVNGWPKWLIDNIPTEVLKDIVPRTAESYLKIDKIGQGTYSNVYKARDKETGKVVALKKVRFDTSEPESVKFMAREIVVLQKLDHPNIVKLQGLATSRMQYSLYLVFDFMQFDLSRILARPDESLTEPQIKCYMQQLLLGLEHCHERGVLHRDIKGSNLLIDKNGMLQIADFGLASLYNPEKRRPLTSRVVTLWYRAPELLLGSTDYGTGIDLWSAGCLMAEMFATRPILPGRTEVEQVHRIFKLCGTPADDYFTRLKLSTSLKPPQTYKSSLGEVFKNFPSSSLGLLSILLALDPADRGSAGSALQNEFFRTSPLACDLSGLPEIHVEDDEDVPINDRLKRRTSRGRRRSQLRKGGMMKKSDPEKPKEDVEDSQDQQKSSESSIFVSLPGSNTSSGSAKQMRNKESPPGLFPSPVVPIHEMSSRSEAHPNASRNIKNRPPLPAAKIRTINYNMNDDLGMNGLDLVERSASSGDFRSLKNTELIELYPLYG